MVCYYAGYYVYSPLRTNSNLSRVPQPIASCVSFSSPLISVRVLLQPITSGVSLYLRPISVKIFPAKTCWYVSRCRQPRQGCSTLGLFTFSISIKWLRLPFFFHTHVQKSHSVRASSSSEPFWNEAKSYEWKLTYTDSPRCACVWFRIQLQPVLLEFVVKLIKAEHSYSISMIAICFHYISAPLTSYRGKWSPWCVYIIDVINSGVRLCGLR